MFEGFFEKKTKKSIKPISENIFAQDILAHIFSYIAPSSKKEINWKELSSLNRYSLVSKVWWRATQNNKLTTPRLSIHPAISHIVSYVTADSGEEILHKKSFYLAIEKENNQLIYNVSFVHYKRYDDDKENFISIRPDVSSHTWWDSEATKMQSSQYFHGYNVSRINEKDNDIVLDGITMVIRNALKDHLRRTNLCYFCGYIR